MQPTIWSPSSWDLWKKCPAKYRIKHLERWKVSGQRRDTAFAKLAIPGLVVDKLLQFWLIRKEFDNTDWLADNFEMIWALVEQDASPKWSSDDELGAVMKETMSGLDTAVRMLRGLDLKNYQLIPQATFHEQITDSFSITGSADLLMVHSESKDALLIDFKNAHSRERMTKDQLVIYQMGLEQSRGLKINRGGYLLFNPRLEQWKWFDLHPRFRARLVGKLTEATEDLLKGEFAFHWNRFTCMRFCEVRFSCELFLHAVGRNSVARDSGDVES